MGDNLLDVRFRHADEAAAAFEPSFEPPAEHTRVGPIRRRTVAAGRARSEVWVLLNVADRVEGAVTAHVLPVPERLRAARLFVTVLTALFVVVAVACAAGAEWAAASAYGVVCVGCAVFRRRFLGSMRSRV